MVDQLKLRFVESIYDGDMFNVANVVGSNVLNINTLLSPTAAAISSASTEQQQQQQQQQQRPLDDGAATVAAASAPGIAWPALLHACAAGNLEIVTHLLSVPGIDITFHCPRTGCSALLMAAWLGDEAIVEALLLALERVEVDRPGVDAPPVAVAQHHATRGTVQVCDVCQK